MQIKDIPITYGGLLSVTLKMHLQAFALYALKIPVEDIAKGLASFEASGRFQIFHMDGYK